MRIKYKEIFSKGFIFNFRRLIVETYFKLKSIRKTAKLLQINPKTVLKWVRRYKESSLSGLMDKKRSPKRIPHKISPEDEKLIVYLRKRTNLSARRLKIEFGLPFAVSTIHRVIKKHGLVRERKIKQSLKPFQLCQMDVVKYLTIPSLQQLLYLFCCQSSKLHILAVKKSELIERPKLKLDETYLYSLIFYFFLFPIKAIPLR